jgi:hypothetical protein
MTLRLDGSDEDAKRKLNRAGNLRAIPRSSPDFARLCPGAATPRASTARSRTSSTGIARTASVTSARKPTCFGFALMVNSLTLARHRARERVATAA